MEEVEDSRKWDELLPDALGLIFKNLSLFEVLSVVPRVCKSWGIAATGPYCWQEIDIEEWSRHRKPEVVDRMLRLLIARSCGSLRKLTVSGLSFDKTILFIADHAQSLRSLRLPRSEINDVIVGKAAGKLYGLTFVDLSYCISIGAEGLEALGKNCKSLTGLRRIMHPLEVIEKLSQDDEARAIAATMPKLKNLEIAYLLVDTASVIEILKKCEHLELLDVRGCWNVNLEEKFVKMFPKLKVVGPLVVDCYDMNGWDNCSDYSGSSGYLAWDFVAGDLSDDNDDDDEDEDEDEDYPDILDNLWEEENPMDDVEMWFYDDVNAVDAGYDWPQSP